MSLICPVCKATVETGPACRRCRTDLSTLFDLEVLRQQFLQHARFSTDALEAREAAQKADQLRSDEESLKMLAVLALRSGDFLTALRCRQQLHCR